MGCAPLNALLVLDKPQGLSSHGAVHRVRKITGETHAGHAGTLDPMATGALLILLGSAARLAEWIVDHDKKYRATVQLGVETDTYDATGTVVKTFAARYADDAIRAALASFVGKQNQVPPAHSAIQIQGKRAYKLARQGVEIAMPSRAVEIFSITNIDIENNAVAFDIHCSKGTYIRSLAHDLGAKLGAGAHLAALRRTASGNFSIAQSLTLAQVEAAVADQTLEKYLLPMDLALGQFDAVHLDANRARAICNGQFISAPANLTTPLVRAYDEQGNLIAILERVSTQQLKPKKVLSNAP
ncbi:MAG: tRNA pseudouridine(55) synthase TruB [Chloroflexi bacterium]|nr:MAG: tRNA pseudouridine(55) synthase TruB [Chloroflexota bacterium]